MAILLFLQFENFVNLERTSVSRLMLSKGNLTTTYLSSIGIEQSVIALFLLCL